MILKIYQRGKYDSILQFYQLDNTEYSDTPLTSLAFFKGKDDIYPILIFNDFEQLVGFLILDKGDGLSTYGFPKDTYALIRSFSIDQRFQRKGHAKACLNHLLVFAKDKIDTQISHLVLAVNERNIPARKLYQSCGFCIVKSGIVGKKGNLLLMQKDF